MVANPRNTGRHVMAEFCVTATCSPDLNDEEVRRRLGRVYRIILDRRTETTAGRGEFGDPARTAAGDAPTVEPKAPAV